LLYAARLTGQSEWEAIALRILRYAARNRGKKTRVYDAGLCHGALGNAHLFNRIFQATSEDIFRDAACFWYARAFELRQPHVGVAGFAAYHPDTSKWVESFEMFNGAAGAGLALLAASSDILPAWDECMMVSIPPRS
jgi:lantibiotic biosynthesis protein